jgi:hypothetical protein
VFVAFMTVAVGAITWYFITRGDAVGGDRPADDRMFKSWEKNDVAAWLGEQLGLPVVAAAAAKEGVDGAMALRMAREDWMDIGASGLNAAKIMGAMDRLVKGGPRMGRAGEPNDLGLYRLWLPNEKEPQSQLQEEASLPPPPPLELDGEAGLERLEGILSAEAVALRSMKCQNMKIDLRERFAAAVGQPGRFASLERLELGRAHGEGGGATNSIGSEGAAALVKGCPGLTYLNVGYNNIGEAGAVALAKLFNLTELDVEGNKIGPTGAVAVAKGCSRLTTLNVTFNQIGDQGAVALAAVGCPSLTDLDVQDNMIGDEGAVALANMLGLVSLNLIGTNNVGVDGEAALRARVDLKVEDLGPAPIPATILELNEAFLFTAVEAGNDSLVKQLLSTGACDINWVRAILSSFSFCH